MSQTEAAANQTTVTEQFSHLFRGGAGGDIEIFGFSAQQQVADTAAHQISFVT